LSETVRKFVMLAAIAVWSSEIADAAWSQRVQPQSPAAVPGGASDSFGTQSGFAPIPPVMTAPAARLQAPTFDPYSNPSDTVTLPPSMYNAPSMGGAGVPMLPNSPGSFHGSPSFCQPGMGYPSTGFPAAPPVLFPDGVAPWGPDAVAGPAPWGPPLRLFYGPRLQHTYLMGDGHHPREFDWNKTDVSVAMALPNFLWTGQPIFFVPAFGLNLWDGPQFQPGADLPGQSYEAYIDAGWQSDPNRILGADLGVRVGIFTDFNTLTSNSIRILGKGLLRYRMSPTVSVRGGVLYVDRLTTKLLPAGGVLWTPNPQTRIDLYFPEPKASRYLRTLGNFELWT
jgi:hypothetical protein